MTSRPSSSQGRRRCLVAIDEGLRDLGYVEGRNIVLERRSAGGRPDKLPELAAELVRLQVDVIVAPINPRIAAAKRATTTIPIVMVHAGDPVEAGYVASLARPGGNITGLTFEANTESEGKRLATTKADHRTRRRNHGSDRLATSW